MKVPFVLFIVRFNPLIVNVAPDTSANSVTFRTDDAVVMKYISPVWTLDSSVIKKVLCPLNGIVTLELGLTETEPNLFFKVVI